MQDAYTRSRDAAAGTRLPAWLDRTEYPFASQWLDITDGRLHYIDEGEGEGDTLLFVHGTPTWSFEWRHLIRALSSRYRCVAPDHLGFGLSDRPAGADYSPETHSRRLAEFVDKLGLNDVTLVVHDYGGPIALPLALESRIRVRRLVVLNSWMWSFEDDASMRSKAKLAGGALGRFLYQHLNFSLKVIMPSAYADRGRLTPAIHAQYLAPFTDKPARATVLWALARGLLGSANFYQSLWNRRGALQRLPTLIVWGLRDSAFAPHQLAKWREALPTARVVELPVGHWPHEEAPAEVVGALRSFLEATEESSPQPDHRART